MKLGPVMIDVQGLELTAEDRERLRHPQVGSVILFARNFESPRQLLDLTRDIRALRTPSLPIAVDHEGGRVQRFRRGFTIIPPMRELGRRFDADQNQGLAAARACGLVIGTELQAHGVDFSFTPVLDLDHGGSSVIGDRAFHRDPATVTLLARALQAGLDEAGMTTVGKHFPGHGFVRGDSHHEVPVDKRPFKDIERDDLQPFMTLAGASMGGVMPAHVIYPAVDDKPAGFSRIWLQDILRKRLKFDGVIFSDDLSMEGASTAGGMVERAEAAFAAGCDVVPVCNSPASVDKLLDGIARRPIAATLAQRLERMRGRAITDEALETSAAYLAAVEQLGAA